MPDDYEQLELPLKKNKGKQLELFPEGAMKEKLGVVTEPPRDKTASAVPTCPGCGSRLVAGTNVQQCPNCGTKPFERGAGGKEEG